ncbi:MAG: hypothetical protein GYA24_20870 [Candidatus Lokiarchaeota archaeon]|nr:hypothetical protein [Candidatus Lokiarchaeota archaeon]
MGNRVRNTAETRPARAGLAVFYNPYEAGGDNARAVLEESVAFLSLARFTTISAPVLVHDIDTARQAATYFREQGIKTIIVHLATWTGDDLLMELVSWLGPAHLLLWALRDMNSGSLCGCQQFNMVLHELDLSPSDIVIGRDAAAINRFNELVSWCNSTAIRTPPRARNSVDEIVHATVDELQRVRVGIIGARTPGMMEVSFDEFGIKASIGPVVCSIPVCTLERKASDLSRAAVEAAIGRFKEKFYGASINAAAAEVEVSIRNYLALKELAREHHLDAITIDCYPGYMGRTCVAFSMLADEGIACACEADVHAAIVLWLVQRLSKQPANHIDTLDADLEGNTMTGGHCGSCSTTLAPPGQVAIAPVRLANEGACVVFPQKAGPVTLVNLVGRTSTFRACVLTGTAIDGGLTFPGNPVTIKLDARVDVVLATIASRGLGHHWIVGQGTHYAPVLQNLFQTLGVKVISVS